MKKDNTRSELDKLLYGLMYAKDFNPHKIGYWEQRIKEHKEICQYCGK